MSGRRAVASHARAKGSGSAARAPSGRRLLRGALAVALAFTLGWFVNIMWPDPLRPSADAVVPGVAPVSVRIAAYREVGGGVEVAPSDGNADTLLILIPGGSVRPHAYTWIGVALAPIGVRTIVPAMPLDLALLAPRRVDALLGRRLDGERRVVLAGHSLGGHVGAAWLEGRPDAVDALVLLGAYPGRNVDLSTLDLPTLVLAAEHDGLATRREIEAGLARLPGRAGVEVIDGAVHAFFGRYGTQRGDGLPTVPRARAENEIAGALEAFIVSLR